MEKKTNYISKKVRERCEALYGWKLDAVIYTLIVATLALAFALLVLVWFNPIWWKVALSSFVVFIGSTKMLDIMINSAVESLLEDERKQMEELARKRLPGIDKLLDEIYKSN